MRANREGHRSLAGRRIVGGILFRAQGQAAVRVVALDTS